ncbi:fructosamine kinase family protein [Aliiglaciecola sp.]|nr:fructosamine kinase family protein [Aliiglaciecola sp.]
MWHFISEQISQQIEHDFICADIREINSGDSHKSFRISDGKRRFFVKTNSHEKRQHFEAEAQGLTHIQNTHIFKVPNIICFGEIEEHSFLVLEFLTLRSGDESNWFEFGKKLAQMHKQHTQEMHGWQDDNYIGLTTQPNPWTKKWSQFFAEQRIGYMLQLLAEKGHHLANIEQAVSAIESLLKGHTPDASMLHGDLWTGNTGFNKNEAVIFDPAFYYGDRETDIAMTELFNRFPQTFYQGYDSIWPLPSQYQYRKPIYQLYHILNHALLFGGHYLQSAEATLKNLEH